LRATLPPLATGGRRTRERRVAALVLDQAAEHLFRFVATAYEKRGLNASINTEFERWTRFVPDETVGTAVLDRLLHHCQVVRVHGESFRSREARGDCHTDRAEHRRCIVRAPPALHCTQSGTPTRRADGGVTSHPAWS
jgi:IstB-like ATP binding protein